MAVLVRQLKPEDYDVSEKDRSVALTEIGTAHMEQLLGQPLRDPDRPEDVTPEQAHLLGFLEQALRAQHLFKRNKDYLVQGGKVLIVDEFTGRLMPGRRWSDGLHQAVEAKEGVRVEPENVTYATITLQNYFRMYAKLAGMTGTALTEAEEFDKIYKLPVLPIPTNLEYQAFGAGAPLVEVKAKDEEGYAYAYFARNDDPETGGGFLAAQGLPGYHLPQRGSQIALAGARDRHLSQHGTPDPGGHHLGGRFGTPVEPAARRSGAPADADPAAAAYLAGKERPRGRRAAHPGTASCSTNRSSNCAPKTCARWRRNSVFRSTPKNRPT